LSGGDNVIPETDHLKAPFAGLRSHAPRGVVVLSERLPLPKALTVAILASKAPDIQGMSG